MNLQVLVGFLLTILPVFELRGGLPIIVDYVVKNGLSIWPYFVVVLLLNISVIFFIFLFLDFLHDNFMKISVYRKFIGKILFRIHKKTRKLKERMEYLGFFALVLFVAVPLPGTGAWTGTLVAWALKLDRFKSFISIALGVIIAGFLILFASLGIFSGFY